MEVSETDRNFEVFEASLPSLLAKHAGEHVLLHNREFIGFYATSLEATIAGMQRFGLGNFSVQEVRDKPEHLGFYSYVGGTGTY